jgi:hypothetical protein
MIQLPECMRCVPHGFLLFLGGAWVVSLLGFGDRWQWSGRLRDVTVRNKKGVT